MPTPRRIDIDELRRLAEGGEGVCVIIDLMGLRHKQARALAIEHDIEIPDLRRGAGYWKTKPQTWTSQREQQLIDMREAGHSFAMIGAVLGITKNQAVGKANRMALCQPIGDGNRDSPFWLENDAVLIEMVKAGASQREISARLGRSRKAIFVRLLRLRLRQRVRDAVMRREIARVQFPPSGHCLFPNHHAPHHPEFAFCGSAQRQGSSYCPEHHRIAWRPVERKQRAMAVG